MMLTMSLVSNSPAIENENQLGGAEDTIKYMSLPEGIQILYLAGMINGMG